VKEAERSFRREEAESWSDEAESQTCAVLRVRKNLLRR